MLRTGKIASALTVLTLGTLLAACASSGKVGSLAGGECRLVRTPDYAVKGRTTYDQNWIDDTTERLVGGCGQARPKARPVGWDVAPAVHKPAPANPPKKNWRERIGL